MAQKAMVEHWLIYLLTGALLVMNTNASGAKTYEMVNVTYIESAVAKGAVCVDGSPPAYYFAKGSGDGVNNWMIFLNGGGWCVNETECLKWLARSSTTFLPINLTGLYSSNKPENPDFYNWNRVEVIYCDGSSFMGDVEAVDPETKQYRRGARVFKAVIEELLTKGLANAENVMFSGNSAGGLAAMVHCDSFRAVVPKASRYKCLAGSSFFIHAEDLPGAEERKSYYSKLVEFHNITILPESCTSKMDPGLCVFPENFMENIQTPLFVLNSAFDLYQIRKKLPPIPSETLWNNCTSDLSLCTSQQLDLMSDFGISFQKTFKGVGESSSRGVFITSCYYHDFLYRSDYMNGEELPKFKLGDTTMLKAIGDWYFDRSSVNEIDTENKYPVNCTLSS